MESVCYILSGCSMNHKLEKKNTLNNKHNDVALLIYVPFTSSNTCTILFPFS